MRKILYAVFPIFSACADMHTDPNGQIKEQASTGKNDYVKKPVSLTKNISTFLDSLANRQELSIIQIRNHTRIDSVFFTGIFSNAVFSGDTLFKSPDGFLNAIISYDDRISCIYKFWLVFRESGVRNTDSKLIFADCDHDQSAAYITLNYRLSAGGIVETTEGLISADGKRTSKASIQVKWKIKSSGMIDSVRDAPFYDGN